MRQARTHTWAPGTSPKHKSLQDLRIRVNLELTKEVMHHAGLQVDSSCQLDGILEGCRLVKAMLEGFTDQCVRRYVVPTLTSMDLCE
jgi:hypothetical protein